MKLSIITINYNNKAGLEKTIESVMSQTWRDFEWIIIDGGSTDGTKEVIEELAKNPDANISCWCSEPDKGIYNAMNKGIAKANGEYLNFMNSGDCYASSTTLSEVFSPKPQEDIVVGKAIRQDNGEEMQVHKSNSSNIQKLIERSLPHQACFIKTSLQKQCLYDEKLKIVSDWKFLIYSVLYFNASIYFIPNIVAVMDVTGISTNNYDLVKKERLQVLDNIVPPIVLTELYDLYRLRSYEHIQNFEFLRNTSDTLFVLCRRFVSIVTFFCNLFKRK